MRTEEKFGRGIIDVEDLLPHELVFFGPHSEGSHDLDEPLLARSQRPALDQARIKRRRSILVVEDEPEIAQLLQYQLRSHGYQVVIVRNGREALSVALQDRPDLIILDLLLPELHGFEVCRLLKGAPATRRIPVIMLTALAQSDDKQKGFALGADDYITKPFNVRELLARVNAVLSRTYPH